MTNTEPAAALLAEVNHTAIGRMYSHLTGRESSLTARLLLIIALVAFVHVMLGVTRYVTEWIVNKSRARQYPLGFVTQQPKFTTFIRLIANSITSIIYFFAFGLLLQEFGVNLTAYLASASIVGLAISFGSQGMVQDMVIGLTLIFSDAMDVGDMVEILGNAPVVGRVEEIGLRFTKLVNLYNQTVFIPNRTIANVSRFPLGGVQAYADVQLPAGVDPQKAVQVIDNIARGMWHQFGAIILSEPVIAELETTNSGWDFVRVQFKIWPGQGALIETTFRQQVVSAMKLLRADYADWQVPVTYRAASFAKTLRPLPKTLPDESSV
ncbi:MAG TPA: mechanosensitive ion channel domain-containing protein [Verrucomicrobiae bacterium]|nr:mechanosensitive ion channel domain-containing protein [Verrucomicrobiae bacterium]